MAADDKTSRGGTYEAEFVVQMMREWEQLIEMGAREEARAARRAECYRIRMAGGQAGAPK